MGLKRILPAFAVKESGFPSVSVWKLLFKYSNINYKHFVKNPPTNKQELGSKKRYYFVSKLKER